MLANPRRFLILAVALSGLGLAGLLIFASSHQKSFAVQAVPLIDLTEAAAPVRHSIQASREELIRNTSSGRNWGVYGMTLLAHEFDDAATECFREATRVEPRSFQWHYALGLSAAAKDSELATLSFQTCRDLRPQDPLPPARLGELLLKQGKNKEAAESLSTAVRLTKENDPRPLQALARVKLLLGESEEALQLARKSNALAPDQRMTLEVLAKALAACGEKKEAEEVAQRLNHSLDEPLPWNDPHAQKILSLRKDEAGIEWQVNESMAAGDQAHALQMVEEGLRDFPDSTRLRIIYARVLIDLGRHEDAVEVLNRLIEVNAKSAEAQFLIGVAMYLQGRRSEALNAFQQTLLLKPDHAMALMNSARCLHENGENTEAIAALTTLLSFQPANKTAMIEMAQLEFESGRPKDAIERLQKLISMDPSNTEAKSTLREIQNRK